MDAGHCIVRTGDDHWYRHDALGCTKSWYNNMMAEDRFDKSIILISSVIFCFGSFYSEIPFGMSGQWQNTSPYFCFSVVGGYMMVTFSNLVMLFLGVEIPSIPVYVLAGSNKKSLKSNESAFSVFYGDICLPAFYYSE